MLREIKFQGHKIIFDEQDEVDNSIAAEIFKLREYRAAEPVISAAKIVLDVGAHIGLFTLYCRALNPSAKIFALEPEPNNLKRLNANLVLNSINQAKTLSVALAAKTGQARLTLTPDSHNHYLGREDGQQEGIGVKTCSLSHLKKQEKIGQIDLIKMDIEGAEYEILESWGKSDWTSIKNIILEYHEQNGHTRQELEKLLRENGFGVQIFPSKFDRTMGFIWASNKRLSS